MAISRTNAISLTTLLVASLGLLEELSPNVALTSMIQAFNRFLLDKIAEEFKRMLPPQSLPSIMDQVNITTL